MNAATDQHPVVLAALRAAGLRPERCGKLRAARLADPERQLYRWVLQQFAEAGRPSREELDRKARALGLDPAPTKAVLAQEDLIHFDAEGELAVAYPFSGRSSRHRVTLAAGHQVWAMCAIDALGLAAMLRSAIEIHSTDPSSGNPITVRVDAEGNAEWQPSEAVVVAGSIRDGPSYAGCCGVLNFFASRDSAQRYLAGQAELRGHVISLPEAVAVGAAVFGDALAR